MKRSFLIPRSLNYFAMRQRPQNLFTEFSKLGNSCYWINEDCGALDGAKKVNTPFTDKDGVNLFPQNTRWQDIPFDTLYFSYPPCGIDILNERRPEFSIFDSLDSPKEGSPFAFWNAGGSYYKALEKSDLVLATSSILLKEAQKYNENVLYVPNAVDFEHFTSPTNIPEVLKDEKRPIIGYAGALASWYEWGLLYQAATRMPECLFVLIGSSFVQNTIPPLPNVKFLGHIPYSEVPSYVQNFDVCTIPFIPDKPEIKSCDPIKLYEYFSLGKPTVTTAMKETHREGVYWSQDTEEYIENLYKALDERGNKKRKARIEMAKKNTWKIRAESIIGRMEELL